VAVVGSAEIIVRAITTGVKDDIQRAFNGSDAIAERAGTNAGSSFSRGFRKGGGDPAFLFGKSINDRDLNKFAEARKRFQSLARAGYILGPAIVGVGGAIGAVVGGLGTLISVTAAATPALLGLSGAFLAVGISAAVLRAAFGGVGDAIKAGAKVTQGGADNADALARANERLADAYYNLDEVARDNAKRKADAVEAESDAAISVADAALAVERAERSYQGAVKNTEKALEDVTKAREEAKEAIQQLRFELEGGVISEKKARLEFEKARESLQRVQDLPPNSRARREAELAFAEADLNLRKAIDKNGDLRKENAKANKEGVDGNQRVVDAQNALVAAKQEESDAQIDAARSVISYREALEDLKKAQDAIIKGGEIDRQNARALELAYRELEAAKKAVADAGKGTGTDDFQAALDKLSPAAQDFVKYILSLKDAFEELRKKLQEAFFPAFTDAVKLLVNTYLLGPDSLEDALVRIAAKLGELSKLFAEAFTTPEKIAEITALVESVTPIIDALGKALIALASAFVTLQAAFIPYTIEFAQFLQKKAEDLKNTIELKKATGELNEIFKTATDIVRDLGEAFGNAFSALGTIIAASVGPGSGGQFFLDWLKEVTAKWETTTKALSQTGELQTSILGLTVNFTKILDILGLIIVGILQIGASKGFGVFLDYIKEAVIVFNSVGTSLADNALPSVGRFILKMAEFIKIFTDAGAITIFFDTLSAILTVITALLDNAFGRALLIVTGSILAFSVAMNTATTAATFYMNSLKGALTSMISLADTGLAKMGNLPIIGGMITKLRQELMFLTYGAGAVSAPFLAIAAAVAAVIAILIIAYNKSEIFRKAVQDLVDAVGGALRDAFKTIENAIKEVFPAINGFGDLFKEIGDFIGKYIVPAFEVFLVGAINFFADTLAAVIKVVAGIFKIFTGDISGVKDVISGFVTFLGGVARAIVAVFKIGNIWGFLSDGFKATINKMIDWWNNFEFGLTVPSNVITKAIGLAGKGFTITTPNIAKLAMGGIVPASNGGTLAMIGEAGRPERVEPLDPDGLSKRDKAMIDYMSAGAGGINITVNPSPGMDERELANLVSRQLAFQLRKGAA
jgi:hypothetical protein